MKILLLCLSLFVLPAAGWATTEPTTCYRIEMPDSPMASMATQSHTEMWCYQKLKYPIGATYIFNADRNQARAELAIVIEPDGMMTHGSLLAGEVSVHRVQAKGFNPFSVPLQEPREMPAMMNEEVLSTELHQSAQEVLKYLLSRAPGSAELRIADGIYAARVADEFLPWRGYWWAYKGQALSGSSNSPLAKYDRYVKARTGTSPRTQGWENANHTYHGIVWEGHCNGWAASSILRKEPSFSKKDPVSGVTFTVVDQKGILAETDYCANVVFFGKRYRGGRDDIRDVYPHDFHQALLYYIGELGKPLATDYKRGSSVDNHVISGYNMEIKKVADNKYTVVTKISIHKYDGSRSQTPGVAPEYTRIYRYTLLTDATGTPTGGSWQSTNPDFLWVPLAAMDCNTNNPRIDHAVTAEILALPPLETNP
jgi:hypothetical protein